ncbi:LCCL domain [Geosmithia morbida]|uniref:LCCL domain n=1 Tax=Geosmithia morbida TaxID=1094350 RepID=A0A9P5D197_9HYPO|nr:LCCL domain [Geosmithia morbida]KAF4120226.1 LCCL domain [Geosmithia morbida]
MTDPDHRDDEAARPDRVVNDAGSEVEEAAIGDAGHQHPDAPLESAANNTDNDDSKNAFNVTTHRDNPADSSGGSGPDRSTSPLEIVDDNLGGHDGARGSGSSISTPRFLQEERSSRRWNWVPYSVRRTARAVNKWSWGPPNPQPYRITPFFPAVQQFPLYLVDRFLPKRKQRGWLISVYFSLWIITFTLVKRAGTISTEVPGWGTPEDIGCGTTYWSSGNGCGIDGNDCRPFNNSGFLFRCQGSCDSYHVLNPHAVGDQEAIYRSIVVGGPTDGETYYRGDSYICGAAIHAGIIDNAHGGCGVVELIGERKSYDASKRNGIESLGFDTYFPLSFRFVPGIQCSAQDMRWSLLAISTVWTAVLSVFTDSAALFFFGNFVMMFWTVGMATDTPSYSSVASLFSNILGKFLPAMFCAWVIYDKMGVKRTLGGLTAQLEKTVLWLGPCWVGALDNYTLDFIPIQRLTGHDLEQQPGAKAALAVIVIVLTVIVASQVWFFRQEGRFRRYIKVYALFIGGIVIALLLPGLDLRIHHYILALLLLPGTSMQMRPSLVYQGLLVGLFINGIARWGFDSVLQTPDDLRGDAQLGTELPVIPTPEIALANSTAGTASSNITFTWNLPSGGAANSEFDGISILVNDVERFRSYFDDSVGQEDSFVWQRDADLAVPEYFRFAFMDGSSSGDYTKAGTWTAQGEWVTMKPGPSKIKARDAPSDIVVKGRRR